MDEIKIQTTIGLCVDAVTKAIMEKYHITQEEAYSILLKTELYRLLLIADSRLFLETNEYLIQCCNIELDKGEDALYDFFAVT